MKEKKDWTQHGFGHVKMWTEQSIDRFNQTWQKTTVTFSLHAVSTLDDNKARLRPKAEASLM
jgi:hypothetical protein